MTRSRHPAQSLDHLPPRPRLLPPSLRLAPELSSLAIVDDALRSALVALLAEHPTLDDLPTPREPVSLRRARRLVAAACALRHALDHYRAAVQDVCGRYSPPDDLPF